MAPVTAVITDTHAPPTHYVVCPVCGGWVAFNRGELERRGGGSIYCAGPSTPTNGGSDPNNHWHPSNALKDAGEILAFQWSEAEVD